MSGLRTYGQVPFRIAVVHGGPGAAGEMAAVARELASDTGILEPFQTESSVQGQIAELKQVLDANAILPVILIGFSWGAWLSCLTAEQYPDLVQKLILVSSGPFEVKYSYGIHEMRMNRLDKRGREEIESLMKKIDDPKTDNKNILFERFGELISKSDAYDPLDVKSEKMEYRYDIFRKVWPEADALRRNGKLLEQVGHIGCSVVAIHGDHDPHPAEGVRVALSKSLKDFRFILLEKCGHRPWIEKWAREKFFQVLKEEIDL